MKSYQKLHHITSNSDLRTHLLVNSFQLWINNILHLAKQVKKKYNAVSHHLVIYLKKIANSTKILPRLHYCSYRLRERTTVLLTTQKRICGSFSANWELPFLLVYPDCFFLKSNILMSKWDHLQEIIKTANKELLL